MYRCLLMCLYFLKCWISLTWLPLILGSLAGCSSSTSTWPWKGARPTAVKLCLLECSSTGLHKCRKRMIAGHLASCRRMSWCRKIQIRQAEGTCCRHIKEQFHVNEACKIPGNNTRGKTRVVWSNQSSGGVQPGEAAALQTMTDLVRSSYSSNRRTLFTCFLWVGMAAFRTLNL